MASRRPLGNRAMPRHSTHADDITTRPSVVASGAALFLFVFCPLNIVPVKADKGGGSGAGELYGWQAVLFPCRCRAVQTWINDPRLQFTVINHIESAVSSCLNESLYS